MDPITIAMIGSALGPMLGGVVGRIASQGDRDKAFQAAQDAYAEIAKAGIPPDQSAPILLKHFQQVGILTPEMEHDINIGVSQVSQIQEDPALRNAQMGALGLLMQRAQSGGLNAEDRVNLNKIRNQVQSEIQAKQAQILQNFQQRGGGVGGGSEGAELAAQLTSAQSGANRESQEADQVAAQAQQAALQAAMTSGNMAGQVRNTDFSNAQAKASAADQFKRFDIQNQINTQQRNVASKNAAQQTNLNTAQQLSNANTSTDNQEKLRQLAAAHQYWIDQLGYHGALGQAELGKAGVLGQKAQDTAGMFQGIGSGVGAGAAALGQNATNQSYLALLKQNQQTPVTQPSTQSPNMTSQVPQFNGQNWENDIYKTTY